MNSAPSADTKLLPGSSPKTHEAPEPKPTQSKAQTQKEDTSGNVKVFCRFRPLNQRELNTTGSKMCCQFPNDKTCTLIGTNVKTGQLEPIPYVFDQVYDPSASQAKLYETAVTPIVDSVLKGYNGTILAYG